MQIILLVTGKKEITGYRDAIFVRSATLCIPYLEPGSPVAKPSTIEMCIAKVVLGGESFITLTPLQSQNGQLISGC